MLRNRICTKVKQSFASSARRREAVQRQLIVGKVCYCMKIDVLLDLVPQIPFNDMNKSTWRKRDKASMKRGKTLVTWSCLMWQIVIGQTSCNACHWVTGHLIMSQTFPQYLDVSPQRPMGTWRRRWQCWLLSVCFGLVVDMTSRFYK